jgi:hypothetical protein
MLIDSIKSKGLLTKYHETNPYGNTYTGVYLMSTNIPSTQGERYGKIAASTHGGQPAVIYLRMKQNEISFDPDDTGLIGGRYQYVSGNILPNRIVDIN